MSNWSPETRARLEAWLSNKPKRDFADLRAALAEIDRLTLRVDMLKAALRMFVADPAEEEK